MSQLRSAVYGITINLMSTILAGCALMLHRRYGAWALAATGLALLPTGLYWWWHVRRWRPRVPSAKQIGTTLAFLPRREKGGPNRATPPSSGIAWLEDALLLSVLLLDLDELPSGMWGRTIMRYAELHKSRFSLSAEQRNTLSRYGSATHTAHAMSALGALRIVPSGMQRTITCFLPNRNFVQPDGSIFPFGADGCPCAFDWRDAKTAGRHTSTGAISYLHCLALARQEIDQVFPRALAVLRKNADQIAAYHPEYSHAYVLEAAVYGLLAHVESARGLAQIMATALLEPGTHPGGCWLFPKTADQRSQCFFSCLIAERLHMAARAGILRSSLRDRAERAVGVFIERTAADLTDRVSGGVLIDEATGLTDYGTTARCARLALGLGEYRPAAEWLRCLAESYPRGLLDGVAHTHTWEAVALLGIRLLPTPIIESVRARFIEYQRRTGSTPRDRILPLLQKTPQQTAEQFQRFCDDLQLAAVTQTTS